MIALILANWKIGAGAIAGAILAGAALIIVNAILWLPAAREEGRAAERTAALQKSLNLIKERSETNAEINRMDDASICNALGGVWVSDRKVCE